MANSIVKTRKRNEPLFTSLAEPAPSGTVFLYWLGQAGFAMRTASSLFLIDPYLSNALGEKYKDALFKHTRMMASPITPDEVRGVDYILSTHAHSDHLDPGAIGTMMAMNPDCTLICSKSSRAKALERGADPDRLVHPTVFEKRKFGHFELEMLPSAHEVLENDAEGNPLNTGFVIETNGMRLYHSGDCVPYAGLADVLRERRIDIALLPVNGRDEYRTKHGILGNFTVEEAVALCVEAKIGYLIPHHFGMFDFNTVPAAEVASRIKACNQSALGWLIPDVMETMLVSKCSPSLRSLVVDSNRKN